MVLTVIGFNSSGFKSPVPLIFEIDKGNTLHRSPLNHFAGNSLKPFLV